MANEYIFGDYKYGTDALDKDLWGDDDIIHGGKGNLKKNQYIYGGDGDDEMHAGSNWKNSLMEGQNGDDDFYLGQLTKEWATVVGGDGNDVWEVLPYGEVTSADANGKERSFGGADNDLVRGTHRAGQQALYGGAGHDKLYGGDAVGIADKKNKHQRLIGGDGDDWLEGGDNVQHDLYMYGDSVKD